MPLVEVTLIEGRTKEKKAALIKAVTDAVESTIDAPRESIRVILMTEQPERLRTPKFGGSLGRFLFEPNTVSTRRSIQERITRELAQWEPRIRVESVNVDPDPSDPQAAIATITYKLVATQAVERVSVGVSLGA